jgi:hypothetical protein
MSQVLRRHHCRRRRDRGVLRLSIVQAQNLKVALIDAKRPGNATRASAGGLWAIGESVGLGCGVIFFA